MRQISAIGMAVLTVGLLLIHTGCVTAGEANAPAAVAATVTPPAAEAVPAATPAAPDAAEPPVLKTQMERASYAIGVETGRNMKRQGIAVDLNLVIRGLNDAMADKKLLLTDEELLATMNIFASELRVKRGRDRLIAAQDNRKEGDEFLAANKNKEGVETLPSGLQYKIIKTSEGRKPTDTDTVECLYRGFLVNGTEFDSTAAIGHPAIFKLSDGSVILGLREALKLMPAGSKWQVFIPSTLAYGQRGAGRDIGPNATLIYELELLAVQEPSKVNPPAQ